MLQEFQLDCVDLYLIHWPVSLKKGSVGIKPEYLTTPNIPNTWRAMEVLYDSGKARAIGLIKWSCTRNGSSQSCTNSANPKGFTFLYLELVEDKFGAASSGCTYEP
ncbi:hypothetical protein PIB30_041025 [Stylosanthes scabra]|uniref:NADP-dependent oxidoreductase domain-containing protein n=1 Tax=Stylosanthes scabra TaxID=79078 RepID=A0ABU6ZDH4_9FABA|nr:hypothetical protein [Stylosanthes scabra]